MHTVELLEEALRVAGELGYRVRHEWLGGSGGGDCEVNGRKWLFVDLALAPPEQLDVALDALRRDSRTGRVPMSAALRERLGLAGRPLRKSA